MSSSIPVRNPSLAFVALWIKFKLPVWYTGPLRSISSPSLQLTSSYSPPCSLHCSHTGLSILLCFPHSQGMFAHTIPSAYNILPLSFYLVNTSFYLQLISSITSSEKLS